MTVGEIDIEQNSYPVHLYLKLKAYKLWVALAYVTLGNCKNGGFQINLSG